MILRETIHCWRRRKSSVQSWIRLLAAIAILTHDTNHHFFAVQSFTPTTSDSLPSRQPFLFFSTRKRSSSSSSLPDPTIRNQDNSKNSKTRKRTTTKRPRSPVLQKSTIQFRRTRKEQQPTNPSSLPTENSISKHKNSKAGGTPSILTNYYYETNRKDSMQQQERLYESSIDCPHFDESCSGCTVSRRVGMVDRVISAQRYFSSTAIRRKRMDVIAQSSSSSQERDDNKPLLFLDSDKDDFFQLVAPSSLTGWRTQAKLVVAPKNSRWRRGDGCMFGLYLRGTHQVMSIPNCAVHHPSINRAVAVLEQATTNVGTPAYCEETREGGLRYVQLQVDRISGTICLTLVWNAENLKETHPALTLLKNELVKLDKSLWHSMWCHCNNGLGNNIFHRSPKRWHRLMGYEFIRERIPLTVGIGPQGHEPQQQGYFYFSPLTFRQGNLNGFLDVLALDVAKAIPGNSKVCELYAGVGVLGLTALVYHHYYDTDTPLQWLRCSDVNPANPRSFARAVESLPKDVVVSTMQQEQRQRQYTSTEGRSSNDNKRTLQDDDTTSATTLGDFRKKFQLAANTASFSATQELRVGGDPKTQYLAASAVEALLQHGQALGANVLVVDPPRKGLDEEVLNELCKPFDPKQPYVESPTLLDIPDHKINWTNDVNTLVYVSCGFDALARDAEKLLNSRGGWVLKSATGYILFPGSDHVETVCVFERE
ncbi:hypothetical protein ACA910_003195 [Epithemia clementina (nom. ined.)]